MRQLLATLLFGLLLASPAAAQLELPGKGGDDKKPSGSAPRGNLVPHLVCSICYERNYTTQIDSGIEDGLQSAPCRVCRKATLHRHFFPGRQKGKSGELILPAPSSQPEAPGSRPAAKPGTGGVPAVDPALPSLDNEGSRAATFIFQEVARLDTPKATLAAKAVESLRVLGEDGVVASRRMLYSDHAATVMVAARVLLTSGLPADRDLIVARLQTRLPAKASTVMVDELVEADPVRGNPRLLIGLLDHAQSGVRSAAMRNLKERVAPEHLTLLVEQLSSKRGETRERALDLIARIDDPAVLEILVEQFSDPRAKVAWSAASAAARLEDPRLDVELLTRAFGERWILRPNAYALLALIEREDRTLEPVLDRGHAEALLAGLSSSDPFVSGVCAAALAGIGFRDPDPEATAWLDREVMDRLVYAVSGHEFHNDYSSLLTPAVRRLKLLSERSFGTDGPEWVEWWLTAREDFYAHRAWMRVETADIGRVRVSYMGGAGQPEAFALIGADLAEQAAAAPSAGERIFLTIKEAGDLVNLMRREGLFSPERLPGRRGRRGGPERALEVLVDGRGKRFVFTDGIEEPWFERVVAICRSLRDQNRWQRYPTPGVHDDQLALWRAEATWWQGPHDPAERAARLKELIFANLETQRLAEREGGVRELERLYASGFGDPADFDGLLELVHAEPRLSGRAQTIIDMAMTSAEVDGKLESGRARELASTLQVRYGNAAVEVLGGLFQRAGQDFARDMAHHEHPLLRAVAATTLGNPSDAKATPADRALLGEMLEDADKGVEAAACLALGRVCAGKQGTGDDELELLRAELLLRARVARSPVREAALQAVGLMGGDDALDALVVGLAEPDPIVKRAAVQGIASLGDPASAPLLVSLLGQGRQSPVFTPAREGLRNLGEAAWSDLLRVAHSSTARARREAALLLSEQGVPQSASVMIGLLTESDDDLLVAEELAVLTCIDFRDEPTPSLSWWEWWDTVVHDDSLAWFLAALERRDLTPPPAESFLLARTGDPTSRREVGRFLLELMEVRVGVEGEETLLERVRRELEAVLERELGELPATRSDREIWVSTLRESVERSWSE